MSSEENIGRRRAFQLRDLRPITEQLSRGECHSHALGEVAHGAGVLISVPSLEVPGLSDLNADRGIDRNAADAQGSSERTKGVYLTHLAVVTSKGSA